MNTTSLARLLGLLTSLLAVAAGALAGQSPAPGTTAIVGATVIDGTGAAPLANRTVLVEAGRILTIGHVDSVAVPDDANTVDAQGAWLLPGFIDAHAHVSLGPVEFDFSGPTPGLKLTSDPDVPLRTLRTLLAHGVTSIRDPGGDPAQLVPLKAAIESGALVGPRMRVAGKVIDRTPFEGLVNQVRTTDDLREAVRNDAAAGVDMAKLYVMLDSTMISAAIAEAKDQGIQTVGHLMTTTWTQAARMGMDHILHIVPGSAELLPVETRDSYLAMMRRGTQFMYGWFERVDLDGPEIQEMIATLVEHDVSVDPTLVIFEGMVRGDDDFYRASEALEMASPSLVENWQTLFTFNTGWSEDDFTAARAAWPQFLELTRRLHEAGVTLTAGTDANNPWIVPGHSFHRELELLVDAGIPTLDVLTIATRNGAVVSGLVDVGTIAPGQWADLVLLEADPVADIRNSRSIRWVMQAGRLMDPSSLLPPR